MFQLNPNDESERLQIFLRHVFRRVFLEDWGTKLIALAITLALWLGVTGLRAPVPSNLDIPLLLRIPGNMEITKTPPQEKVKISLTGDKQKLDRLMTRISAGDLSASVDLSESKAGANTVLLSPDTVSLDLPAGVRFDRVEPSKILVNLEKVIEREIQVKPAVEGELPPETETYSITVSPAKVRVRGAESIINSLDSISTEPINIANRRESFIASQVGLNILNSKITPLDSIVDVNIHIGEKRVERLFVVSLKTENQTKRFAAVLFGARSVIEKLRADELQIELHKNEQGEELPKLILPETLSNQIEVRKISAAR